MNPDVDFAVFGLFAIPVYSSFVEITDQEKDYVQNHLPFKRITCDDGDISVNKYVLTDPNLQSLNSELHQHIDFFVKTQMGVGSSYSLEIKNSWALKHHRGDHAEKHYHANSFFSGVVYLKCNEYSGDIEFSRSLTHYNLLPPNMLPNYDRANMFNSYDWKWTPQEHQVFIFPSHLEHKVYPNESDLERTCIAFNVWMHGEYGLNVPEELNYIKM